ncbi:methionine ABC transporter ATP-binding protein, partial [Bacillus licheniformis]
MLLEVSDLSVYLQERGTVLLKPITFSLDAGESLVLLG